MKPSKHQIRHTLGKLTNRLTNLEMDPNENGPDKEGLKEAQAILKEGRTHYRSIGSLKTRQARAIALMAIDYMNGVCCSESLTNFK